MAPVPRLEPAPEAPGRQRPGDTSTAGGRGEKKGGIGMKKRGEKVRKGEKKGSCDEDCSPDLSSDSEFCSRDPQAQEPKHPTETNLLPSIGFAWIHQRLRRDALELFSVPDNRVTSQIGYVDVCDKASCSGRC